MWRAMASMRANVCSATETAFPPGVFITSTPASVAASRSTLSTPTPARPMTRRRGALARTDWFTCTALRTSRASATERCSWYSLGFETVVFHPASCRNSSIAAGARGSAISMFISESDRGRLHRHRPAHGRVLVNLLHRGHSGSIFDGKAVHIQDDFQAGNHREEVGEIEVAEVGDAENFPLHRALPVGNDRPKAIAEFLHNDAGIHALGRFDGSGGSGRRIRREQFQAHAESGGARCLRQQLGILDQLRHAELLDVAERFAQREN